MYMSIEEPVGKEVCCHCMTPEEIFELKKEHEKMIKIGSIMLDFLNHGEGYITDKYCPDGLLQSFTEETQKQAKELFGDKICRNAYLQ
ncbi:MAG: hypothetical protein DRQ46_00085 [Gammaproteobacteria bacterium]|nr:MAG: hypothetical protein DRQ46_00085 [Gammaproteobacteria bacterium]